MACQFRLQEGDTALSPWNVEEWCPLEFKDDAARRDFIDESLCSQVDPADRTLVQVAPPPSVAASFDDSDDDDDEDMKEEGVVPAPVVPLAAGSEKERLFVKCALPLLRMKRRTDYESWMKVGFAVATVFEGGQIGRDLFRLWSQAAPNYDQGACDKVYGCAGNKVGVGSIVTWLRADAPAALVGALMQMLQDDDDEEKVASNARATEPSKLDEKQLHALVYEYNAGVAARKADPDMDGNTANALDQKLLTKLTLDIVTYMNRWICIIRRATGRPNIIEEYSRWEKQSCGNGHDLVHPMPMPPTKGTPFRSRERRPPIRWTYGFHIQNRKNSIRSTLSRLGATTRVS
jgi:hypothetical protein